MTHLLPPALCGEHQGPTLHLLSSPLLYLWPKLLQSAQEFLDGSKNWCLSIPVPVTTSPWLHTLLQQTNSQKHSQSLLVLTSCPFSFSMQGYQHEKEPWSSHPAPSIVCPLRLWCTDKQEREARPSTCLPPCSPPFQQPQPAFTAVWRC